MGQNRQLTLHLFHFGVAAKPLRHKLVLRDKFNREFLVGPIDFPYIGPKV
jgi:hypothetical protein